MFNIWYRIRIRILKSYIYDVDIQSYLTRHCWHYPYSNPNPTKNMKTNMISVIISVRIRFVFIPSRASACFPARWHGTTRHASSTVPAVSCPGGSRPAVLGRIVSCRHVWKSLGLGVCVHGYREKEVSLGPKIHLLYLSTYTYLSIYLSIYLLHIPYLIFFLPLSIKRYI